jgi:hypothetical protein
MAGDVMYLEYENKVKLKKQNRTGIGKGKPDIWRSS